MRTLLRLVPVFLFIAIAPAASADVAPLAPCTMDAKLCPDGVTYVGRDGSNNCEWEKCPEANSLPAPFNDVPSDHPNADAIRYLKDQGIVQGYADGGFHPDMIINRAELTKIVIETRFVEERINGCLETNPNLGFFDMSADDWFAKYVCVAKSQDIVRGYPNGAFRGSSGIIFAEVAKIIVRSFDLDDPGALQSCGDDCSWYRPHVEILESQSAIPTSIGSFEQPVTRGEMAEIMFRLMTGNTDKESKTYQELKHWQD